jgi:neurofibromin 1
MTVTVALCDACPSTEVDELTISLLNIFDSRGLAFVLLKALIEHEVDETGILHLSWASIRANSICRK